MKKTAKFVAFLIIALVLLFIVIAVLALNLDRIARDAIETYGSKITKTSLTVQNVHIGLLDGKASVDGFVLGNPPGYKTPNAISVGKAAVAVKPMSFLSSKIVVRSVAVEGPEITFEGGLLSNNLKAIMDNVNGTAQKGGPTVTNASGNPKPSKRLEVDDFLITGAKINGSVRLPGGREISVNNLRLPDIHLQNLGTGPAGITATELTRQVFARIVSATVNTVAAHAQSLGQGVFKSGAVNALKQRLGNLLRKQGSQQ